MIVPAETADESVHREKDTALIETGPRSRRLLTLLLTGWALGCGDGPTEPDPSGAVEHSSRHLSMSWENGLEGEPPAAMATATIEARPDGFPARREYTIWNTPDPDIRTIAVTEYEYEEPGT